MQTANRWQRRDCCALESFVTLFEMTVRELTKRLHWLLSLAIVIDIAAGPHAALAQNANAGSVTGVIDGVQFQDDQYYVSGWACQEGQRGSIDVHIYANHAAGDTPPGNFVTAGKADLGNEPAVDQACHGANGGKHRFRIALPNQLLKTFQNKKLYVHGIAIAGNVENAAIAGSGEKQFPKPRWPVDPPMPNVFDGARVAAFDTRKESCELIDVPD